MRTIKKLTVLVVFFMMGVVSLQAQQSESPVRYLTGTYTPSEGYELRIKLKYKMIWCVDEMVVTIVYEDIAPLAYIYKGKRYSSQETGGFKSGSRLISMLNVSADLYSQQYRIRTLTMNNVVNAWGGCMGQTYSTGINDTKVKSALSQYTLQNFTILSSSSAKDYDIHNRINANERAEQDRIRKEKSDKEKQERGQTNNATQNSTTGVSDFRGGSGQKSHGASTTNSGKQNNATGNAQSSSTSASTSTGQTKGRIYNGVPVDYEEQKKYYENKRKSDVANMAQEAKDMATRNQKSRDETINTLATGVTSMAASIISMYSANREAREAREAAERRRKEEEIRIENERKAYVSDMRTTLITDFKDGRIPLSADKVSTNCFWYFAYRINKNDFSGEQVQTSVTNVFPVGQYADGTWPYKHAVVKEIEALGGTGEVTLVGGFESAEQAQQQRSLFLEIAGDAEISPSHIKYAGKAGSGVVPTAEKKTDNDFWETGKGNSNSQNVPQKTEQTKTEQKNTTNKTNSFWD